MSGAPPAFGVKGCGAVVVTGPLEAIDSFFRDAQSRTDLGVVYLKVATGGTRLRIVPEPESRGGGKGPLNFAGLKGPPPTSGLGSRMTPRRIESPNPSISIRKLKQKFAAAYDPAEPIRVVLEGEPDEMGRTELLAKLPSWIRLIRLAETDGPATQKESNDGRRTR